MIQALPWFTSAAVILHTAVFVVATVSVPGTRQKYVAVSWFWGTAPFALAHGPLSVVVNLIQGVIPLWFAVAMWALSWSFIFFNIRTIMRDDDDNYWRRKKRQLRRWIRRAMTIRVPKGIAAQ